MSNTDKKPVFEFTTPAIDYIVICESLEAVKETMQEYLENLPADHPEEILFQVTPSWRTKEEWDAMQDHADYLKSK